MLTQYHIEMTREALSLHFSERALEIITTANIRQDRLSGQFGHDEYHFDNNAIDKGNRYINEQRGYILATFLSSHISPAVAWSAFGRLLHAAQDFYAHSNYVTLWLDSKNGAPHTSGEIDPLKKDILQSPSLRSGKVYFPMDAIYFIKFLRPLALKLLPKDSHGWMNLDTPEKGFKFDYAISAAVKRTRHEFDLLQKLLSPEMLERFVDK
ncbi:MAG: hypothetical protein HC797_00880 [Anaerolineales bacterium]|nr:hypothetical protein [Anaerolineales bacterium]